IFGAHEEQIPGVPNQELRRVRSLGAQCLQEIEQAGLELVGTSIRAPLLRLFDRQIEASLVDRLQHVVEGVDVEGAERKLVVRRHENHGRVIVGDRLGYLDPVQTRHLNVEQYDVGAQLL